MRQFTNEQIQNRVKRRHNAFMQTRNFFNNNGFCEVDTPILVAGTGLEPHIEPIDVKYKLDQLGNMINGYLHTSPELGLKRIMSYGCDKVYQLCHVFRQGESGPMHMPEFSMLEWYRSDADLADLIDDCQKLFAQLALSLTGNAVIASKSGAKLDLAKPFTVYSVEDLWHKFVQIDLRECLTQFNRGNGDFLIKQAANMGFSLRPNADFDDVFHDVMAKKIEPNIGNDRVCVVNKWPAHMAALSKIDENDSLYAQRFEIYAHGIEIANAFNELVDPKEQLQRFIESNQLRSRMGLPSLHIDQKFLQDLQYLSPCSGIAVGFDRLLMLIFATNEIKETQAMVF